MAKRLRKALLRATTLQDNADAFTNLTGETLHIRKFVLTQEISGTLVAADRCAASLDEVPEYQGDNADSRAHLAMVKCAVGNVSTNGMLGANLKDRVVMIFERGQLTLDPDESLWLNTIDHVGAPTVVSWCNIFYED